MDHLGRRVPIKVDEKDLDLSTAKDMAKEKAKEFCDDPMLLAWYQGKVAKWWIPDAVEFVAELPHTATGKLSKLRLREQFADYRFSAD